MFSINWKITDCRRKERYYAIHYQPKIRLNVTDRLKGTNISMTPIIW